MQELQIKLLGVTTTRTGLLGISLMNVLVLILIIQPPANGGDSGLDGTLNLGASGTTTSGLVPQVVHTV